MWARNSLLAALAASAASWASRSRLVALALADVAGHAEDLHEAAVGAEQRVGRDVGPHRAAVLAALFELAAEVLDRAPGLEVGAQPREVGLHDRHRVGREDLFLALPEGLFGVKPRSFSTEGLT
jgi:acyl transferase domain-containing protein